MSLDSNFGGEKVNLIPPPHRNSPEDIQAAQELIEENSELSNNPRVKMLLENDFTLEGGSPVDAGDFLAAMINYLSKTGTTKESPSSGLDAALDEFTAGVMVVHSRPTQH